MSDLTVGGVLTAVIAFLIGAAILKLISIHWPDSRVNRWLVNRRVEGESERLLTAFREMAREQAADDLNAVLLVEDAARRADVKDPSAAVHRLIARNQSAAHSAQPTPAYVRLTSSGLGG